MGNIAWGINFIVAAQYSDDYYAETDSKLLHFSIKDDKIVGTGIQK